MYVDAFELENYESKFGSRDQAFHKELRQQVKNGTHDWINYNHKKIIDYATAYAGVNPTPLNKVRKLLPVKLSQARTLRLIEWSQFQIDPDQNSDLVVALTPASTKFPPTDLAGVTPRKRWVSLHSGELDSPELPAHKFRPGQWVVAFEKGQPFRFGRVNSLD